MAIELQGHRHTADTDREFMARFLNRPGGQRVSAADRLYLASMIPSLIVWGRHDPLIPAAHGEFAHGEMPDSRLDIFEDAGHFPHLDEPVRFAAALRDFMEETEPAEFDFSDEDLASLRERILEHSAGLSGAGG